MIGEGAADVWAVMAAHLLILSPSCDDTNRFGTLEGRQIYGRHGQRITGAILLRASLLSTQCSQRL